MIEKNEKGLFVAEVDGSTYEFQKWGAEEATRTMLKIAKIVAEPFGIAVGTAVSGSKGDLDKLLDMNFKPEMVSEVINSLMTNMDENTVMDLIKKLCSGDMVICDGQKVKYNSHYQDRLDHQFKVVAAGLEVQYGNFLGALLGLLGSMKRPKHVKNVKAMSTG